MDCLFCQMPELGHKSDVDFICSSCVLLADADQEDLKRAYTKAMDHSFDRKARAIESFLNPEELNVRETEKPKRGVIRKKPMRVVRPSRNQFRPQPATV